MQSRSRIFSRGWGLPNPKIWTFLKHFLLGISISKQLKHKMWQYVIHVYKYRLTNKTLNSIALIHIKSTHFLTCNPYFENHCTKTKLIHGHNSVVYSHLTIFYHGNCAHIYIIINWIIQKVECNKIYHYVTLSRKYKINNLHHTRLRKTKYYMKQWSKS